MNIITSVLAILTLVLSNAKFVSAQFIFAAEFHLVQTKARCTGTWQYHSAASSAADCAAKVKTAGLLNMAYGGFQCLGFNTCSTTQSDTLFDLYSLESKTHTSMAGGDPHFTTWTGERFSFHGGCDLVLVQNPHFDNGLGLNIHIRTSIRTWWSYIQSAVIQIGDNTLEITGGAGTIPYWINGVEAANLITEDKALGDFMVHFVRDNDHQTKIRVGLGNGDNVKFDTFRGLVRVSIKDKSHKSFQGSVGLLGSYDKGAKLARDGSTFIEDANALGQEWQVLASEPRLFHTLNVNSDPTKCRMPTETEKSQKRRRLLGAMITKEEAAEACAGRVQDTSDMDDCIFDVLATQDKDTANSY